MTDAKIAVVIHGRVQGVGYRRWLQQVAEEHGLRGWTRNRADGSVQALLAGPRAALDDVLSLIWEGPPLADVRQVESSEAAPDDSVASGFTVLPDA
jgi:acylphosphatase